MLTASTRYTILVPVFMPDGDTPVLADVLEDTRRQLATRFGGATVEPAVDGSWINDNGETITEPMRPVWSLATTPNANPGYSDEDFVEAIAELIAARCQQDCVLVFADTVRAAFVFGHIGAQVVPVRVAEYRRKPRP